MATIIEIDVSRLSDYARARLIQGSCQYLLGLGLGGYRTTIPREVRKLLGIGESDEAEWVFEDGKIIVRNRMISYPYCDFERGLRLIKTWRYRFYDVTPHRPIGAGFYAGVSGVTSPCGDIL